MMICSIKTTSKGLLKKGDIRGAALTACGHVVEDEDREYHSTPYLARRCSALYPEVAFFVDQTLTDGTSANVEYARPHSIDRSRRAHPVE